MTMPNIYCWCVIVFSSCVVVGQQWGCGWEKLKYVPSFTSSSPHVRECGFRNPRNFCWWNPESGKLLVESGILGFGIQNPSKDLNPESKVPLTITGIQYLESLIHGVESIIQDCLVFPYMRRSSSCTTKWNVASDWCSFSSFVSECQNYGSLNSGSRRTSYYWSNSYCDSSLGPGWFRFQGSAGTRMATSCPSYGRCGTYSSGWLRGGHPSVADGQVTRTVYFNNGYCYSYSTSIKVRNCGSYYVYYLSGTPGGRCNLRYCGTN